MAATLALNAGRGQVLLDTASMKWTRSALVEQVKTAPDFWSLAGTIELSLYEAVAAGALSAAQPSLANLYRDLQARVAAPDLWSLSTTRRNRSCRNTCSTRRA